MEKWILEITRPLYGYLKILARFALDNKSTVSFSFLVDNTYNDFSLSPGVVVDTDGDIRLEDVPIVTPNSDVVVPSLSFQVK